MSQPFAVPCECPWVVCMFELIHIVCNEEHHAVMFLAELSEFSEQWGALLKNPRCGMAKLLTTAELFSLGYAKFQSFGLL